MTSSLLSSIAGSPSAANQFVTDLNQLAQDVKGGNLSAAQQDYVTLSQDALNGATSSSSTTTASGITTSLLSDIASSSTSSNSFVNDLNQLGTDLTNGDLTSAGGDLLSLDSTALNAVPSSNGATSSAGSSTSNKADIAAPIKATTQAMEVGDNSAVNADMSQLASASTSSTGASYLKSDSESYGSSSSGTSLGTASQLLQSLNTDNSSSSGSTLSLLA